MYRVRPRYGADPASAITMVARLAITRNVRSTRANPASVRRQVNSMIAISPR